MRFQINWSRFFQVALCLIISITLIQTEAFAAKNKGKQDKQVSLWKSVDKASLPVTDRLSSSSAKFLTYRLNAKVLNELFADAPMEFTGSARDRSVILELPDPQGKLIHFRIEESPMLSPEVAAKFPTWKTFSGQGIEDPTAVARFDTNANGFHGYVMGAGGTFLIDPYSLTDRKNYIVYYKGDLTENSLPFSCNLIGHNTSSDEPSALTAPTAFSNGTQLRNFKIAFSATSQYTNAFGGNVNSAFAGIQTTVNRLISIYRRDLATTFTLVSGTNTVFTNANTGGFTGVTEQDIPRNQIVLDMIIGNANYDIGHVMSGGPGVGGAAASPSLCSPTQKAEGFTGSPTPASDAFLVDFVAHEIGHQFGMSHTFNNDLDGTCNQREADSAYEPASGVTIMGYGGICAPRNLSKNSIEYFGLRSFDQTLDYLQNTIPQQYQGCGTMMATNNAPPSNVSAGANYNIPKQTPFTLTASATDVNNDGLTYLWEEFDLGAATRNGGANDTDEDGTARPIFRPYNPSTSPSRTFPSLNYILNNSNTPPLTYTGTLPLAPTVGATIGYVCADDETCVTGERLPSIARTMMFRVTVRDNSANGGGVADALTQITVVNTAAPFRVTTQNTAATWQGNSQQTVTWNVSGTTANGINTANVKISLSTDGGQSFPLTISASTPNDGTEQVTIPNTATTQARIKVEAVGNIFFDINDVNFTITASAATTHRFFDFDGDGKADVSVFRPSNGIWYLLNSQSGFGGLQFGASTDKLVPADYDGDGKADVAVFRGDTWYIQRTTLGFTNLQFGQTGDVPVPADYDGDGTSDIAVYRPSSGTWFLQRSQLGFTGVQFGISGDVPIPGDFDGDTKSDLAVFRPSNGIWYILGSTAGFTGVQFGAVGDKLVPADYDGDGKTDVAVFRPSTATWFINRSQLGSTVVQFGVSTDLPTPADYDGDGKTDIAVYRIDTWFLQRSTAGFTGIQFGSNADKPVPNAFVY